ncbi:MAG: hypothetical protein Q4Q20_02110 [Methanocorpusculum sp.]|nr:hypothetical protein [Methanocorpusculum sp.]
MTNENDTVTISFSGEEFRELEARAKEKGMPVEEYITRMIDKERKRDGRIRKGKKH